VRGGTSNEASTACWRRYRRQPFHIICFRADTGVGPIVVYGRGPAQDCYVAATADRPNRNAISVCSLALNHDFLTTEDRTATLVNRGVLLCAVALMRARWRISKRPPRLIQALAKPS
jgi:hypothetical protein